MERSWEDQTPGGHRTGRDPQTKGTGSDQRDQSGNRDTKNANFHKSHSGIRGKRPPPISLATKSDVKRRLRTHKFSGFRDGTKGMKELIYCSQDSMYK